MVWPLCRLGEFEEARRVINQFSKKGKPIHTKMLLAYVMAYTDKESARRLIAEVRREDTDRLASAYFLALASFVLGDLDTGFDLLEQSLEKREAFLLNMKVDYELDDNRSDPRYLSLLNKLGLG
jgi:hypothetical protein